MNFDPGFARVAAKELLQCEDLAEAKMISIDMD